MGQSRVGLQGTEALSDEWAAVFQIETFFNPQSGEIANSLTALNQSYTVPGIGNKQPIGSSGAVESFGSGATNNSGVAQINQLHAYRPVSPVTVDEHLLD